MQHVVLADRRIPCGLINLEGRVRRIVSVAIGFVSGQNLSRAGLARLRVGARDPGVSEKVVERPIFHHHQHEDVLDAGLARAASKIVENELGISEGAIALVLGDPHARVSEAHDVGQAITRGVGQEARVVGDAPALVDPKVLQYELGRRERSVTVAQSSPNAVVAEAYEVGMLVAGQVDDETRV